MRGGSDRTLSVDQNEYLGKLRSLTEDVYFPDFASPRIKLLWLSENRPALCFEISQLDQVTKCLFMADSKAL